MPKVRQDAWSHEDDLLLAETVLRHIREGSTQLRAFDEVGDVLNRTSAACGFRWNAEVRQKYEQAVELAKKQRKERKREEAKKSTTFSASPVYYNHTLDHVEEPQPKTEEPAPVSSHKEMELADVIDFLKQLQQKTSSDQQLQKLEKENERIMEQNRRLNQQLDAVTEDYQSLIEIMDRARKMVMFDDSGDSYKPQFRMEKNGNLENIAR
ncbi:RsfA family transcriptional regulator [Halobacillus fulvus]|nr:RsfA family transcriptional regulator [Halobacillus fulvus]